MTKEIEMSREDAVDMLYKVGIDDFSRLPNKAMVSGKDIFSVLLPDDFNFKGRSRAADKNGKDEVIIKDGKLIEGVIDKNTIGGEAGLMLRSIHKRYGEEKTIKILGNIFRLGIKVLLKRGFTTSLSDSDIPENAGIRVKELLNKAEDDVNALINIYHQGKLEIFPGRTAKETLELKILEILNRVRNETGKVVMEYSKKRTHSLIMAEAGARGTNLNIAQMAACIGQQALRGKRIEKGYNERTLSIFRKGDLSPEAHGFIGSGFKSGMKPSEFFFGAITGRDSLMDTALRTPKSGYLYRRLANAMQDLKVEYDGTVRDASGKIVQFSYGEDGIDVSRSENGKINIQRIIEGVR